MDIQKLRGLQDRLEGELHYDEVMRTLYATDASAYREMPLAVAIPKTERDLFQLVNFARENDSSIIPRTAGTSLAGQVVGNGIIVDVSVNFREILEINKEEHCWHIYTLLLLFIGDYDYYDDYYDYYGYDDYDVYDYDDYDNYDYDDYYNL